MNKQYQRYGSPQTKVIEECSEVIDHCTDIIKRAGKVIKIVCKGERFGYKNFHPSDIYQKPNSDYVLEEIDDLERCLAEFKPLLQTISRQCKIDKDVKYPHHPQQLKEWRENEVEF